MWSYFLANYNNLALLLLGCLVAAKILLTVIFISNYERTVVGVVGYIFKWNTAIDKDMAESALERFVMGFQNFMSIFIYSIPVILIFAKLLTG